MQERLRKDHVFSVSGGQDDCHMTDHQNLAAIRDEGGQLLDAGEDAIRKALSSVDSEQFLHMSRQQGGQ